MLYVVNPSSKSVYTVYRHFPKPGIVFRGMAPFLKNVTVRDATYAKIAEAIVEIVEQQRGLKVTSVSGNASRGYFLATALSSSPLLKAALIPIGKENTLPGVVIKAPAVKEYGDAKNPEYMETNPDLIQEGDVVVISDDLIGNGDTAVGTATLVLSCKAKIGAFCFLGVIPECEGIQRLETLFPHVPIIVGCVFDKDMDPHPSFSKYLTTFDKVDDLQTLTLVPPQEGKKSKILLMAHSTMYAWARELMGEFPELFEFIKLKEEHFDDEMPDLELTDMVEEFEDRDVVFLASNFKLATLFEQFSIIHVLPKQRINSFEIWLPYFATETHERRNKRKVVATADTMKKLISSAIPKSKRGPAILAIADIHAEASEFFESTKIGSHYLNGVGRFLRLLNAQMSPSNPLKRVFAMFPDDGAYKRFINEILDFDMPVMIFEKRKTGKGAARKTFITFKERLHWPLDEKGEPLPLEHGVLIDDLGLSGDTSLETGKNALSLNCGIKYLDMYVTHGRFPKKSYRKFFKKYNPDCPFKRVYCGSSIPEIQKSILLEGADDPDNNPFYFIPLSSHFVYQRRRTRGLRLTKKVTAVVSSKNPDKLKAVANAFAYVFPYDDIHVIGVACKSGVPNQPMGNEIMEGCENRHANLPGTLLSVNQTSEVATLYLKSDKYVGQPLFGSDHDHTLVKNDVLEDSDQKACSALTFRDTMKNGQEVAPVYYISLEDGGEIKEEYKDSDSVLHSSYNRAGVILQKENGGIWKGLSEPVPMLYFKEGHDLLHMSREERLASGKTYGELLCEFLHLPEERASDWFQETYCDTRVQVHTLALIKGLYQLFVSFAKVV